MIILSIKFIPNLLTALLIVVGIVVFSSVSFLAELEIARKSPSWQIAPKYGISSVTPERANAAVVILTQNDQLYRLKDTLVSFEYVFNSQFNYPYIFLNDQPFDEDFKREITDFLTKKYHDNQEPPTRSVSFGQIPEEHWSYPEWIDMEKVYVNLNSTKNFKNDLPSYHHMCRFFSGFLHHHPLLKPFDYYWRVEPGVQFYCKLDYDPFMFMMDNDIQYGFTMITSEEETTVRTLWNTTKAFLKEVYPLLHIVKPEHPILDYLLIPTTNDSKCVDKLLPPSAEFLGDVVSDQETDYTWNLCNVYNNFEIANLNFFRSAPYQNYFHYLDNAGGFYYERWGDSPVHTLAVGMFLDKSQIHHFRDIGYDHDYANGYYWSWCPPEKAFAGQCFCNADLDGNVANWGEDSCLMKFLSYMKPNQQFTIPK